MHNRNNIGNLYFNWMKAVAVPDDRVRNRYSQLLEQLNSIIFYFTIPLDENRLIDGISLRARFGYEQGIPDDVITDSLGSKACTMLEMMVALALRGEEHIMYDPDIGDRLDSWFWEMIKSLRIDSMDNNNFDVDYVTRRVDILLKHNYDYDGNGGLFTVKNPKKDMRKTEIWYQMCWYFDAVLKNE